MAPSVRIQNFGVVDGGVCIPYYAVRNFEDLDELVFSHFERSTNAFGVHYHLYQEPDPCEFTISRKLWDRGAYLPKSDIGTPSEKPSTVTIFAHFTPKRGAGPTPDLRQPCADQHNSNVEPAPEDEQTPTGQSTKEKIAGYVNNGSRSHVDRTRCSKASVVLHRVYSYSDLHPSVKILRRNKHGNTSLLVGYRRRKGCNPNLVYASPNLYQDRVTLRAVSLNMRGEHVDIGGGPAVSDRDTAFFNEMIAVADDPYRLLKAVQERLKQGAGDSCGPHDSGTSRRIGGAAHLTSRRTTIGHEDGGEASNDAIRTTETRTEPSTEEASSGSPSFISVRFVFKQGTRGIFQIWQDFHITLSSDFSSERIVSRVEEVIENKAQRSTRLHPHRTNLRSEIHLGANNGSMALLTAGSSLRDYAASQSDNSNGLLGHVYVFLYKDGNRLAHFRDISTCNSGSERQSEPIPSGDHPDEELEACSPVTPRRSLPSSEDRVVDLSFETVDIDFVVTFSGEAARFFNYWLDLSITIDADAMCSEVKNSLRPHIIDRLKRSKICHNPQSPELISFDFTLEGKESELLPFIHRQSLRDFVLEAGTGPRLTGEITIELPQAFAPSDREDDVSVADPGPDNHLGDDRRESLMQEKTPCPNTAPDSADGRRVSFTSSPLSSPPPLLTPERQEPAQDHHNQEDPIEVVFKFEDRSRNGGKPFRFTDVRCDFRGTAQQQEIHDYLARKVKTKITMTFRPNANELVQTVTFDVDIHNGWTSSALRPGQMLSDYLDEDDFLRPLTANVVLRRKRPNES